MDKQDEILKNIAVPGLKILFQSKCNIWVRVVWAMAILVCTGLFCIEISERIDFFLNHNIRVRIVEQGNTIPVLPKITFCSHHVNIFAKDDSVKIINYRENAPCWYCFFENTTIFESYQKLLILIENVKIMGMNKDEKWREMPFTSNKWNSQIGPCITFAIESRSAVSSIEISLNDTWDTPNLRLNISTYRYYVHEESIPMTPEWLIKFLTTVTGKTETAILDFAMFSNFNNSKNPCVSLEDYTQCRQDCLKKAYNLTICNLPYMKSVYNESLPNCKKSEECFNSVLQASDIFANFNPNKCNCTKKCKWLVYSFQRFNLNKYKLKAGLLPPAIFKMEFGSYSLIEEYNAYNFISLLSDIGGCLGVTLGLSILSLCETISSIVKWVMVLRFKAVIQNSKLKFIYPKFLSSHGSKMIKKQKFEKINEINFPEISIPSVAILLNEKNGVRKFFWWIAILFCITIAVLQSKKHVDYFKNNSIAIRITVNPIKELKTCFLTICPLIRPANWKNNTAFNQYLFNEELNITYENTNSYCNFLRNSNRNISSLWYILRPDFIENLHNNIHFKQLYFSAWVRRTIFGCCYVIHLKTKFSQNQFWYDMNMFIFNKTWLVDGGRDIYILHISDLMTPSEHEIFQNGVTIKSSSINSFSVQFLEFKYINHSHPCYAADRAIYLRTQCIGKALNKKKIRCS